MRIFQKVKDGGDESTVDAYVLCEFKGLFSIIVLKIAEGSRNNYHSHAFNALTWFIKGDMVEHSIIDGKVEERLYKRSLFPKLTKRDNLHKVIAKKSSWCFTIRGRWCDNWTELDPDNGDHITLTHGRKITNVEVGTRVVR